uniref:Dickkopf N-terminal cysteine-rich domain-containing protein n=1 Tax=Ditylenchus dipsaci TaxID=166011 RepID=A0A915E4M4_9BILA
MSSCQALFLTLILVASVIGYPEVCNRDSDCLNRRAKCVDGRCRVLTSYRALLPAECSNSLDCGRGERCINGVCRVPKISQQYRWATVEEDASI